LLYQTMSGKFCSCGLQTIIGPLPADPIKQFDEPVFESDFRLVAEQLSCFRNISDTVPNIAFTKPLGHVRFDVLPQSAGDDLGNEPNRRRTSGADIQDLVTH